MYVHTHMCRLQQLMIEEAINLEAIKMRYIEGFAMSKVIRKI